MIKPLKPSRRRYFASLEQMERREVLSSATVEMVPGSQSQTILPYDQSGIAVIYSTSLSVARDINNQIIDFNKDGLPDLLNMSDEWALNGGTEALLAGKVTNPLLADGTGKFELTQVNGKQYVGGKAVSVLDWNGDGNQDYLALSQSLQKDTYTYWIYQNNGNGIFTTGHSGQLADPSGLKNIVLGNNILCMADFNSDGAPDLLAPNGQSFNLFFGVLENGKWNGNFDDANTQPLDIGSISTENINPQAVDLNGDGKLDIVTPGPTGLRVFINNGSGQFPATGSFDLDSIQNKRNFNLVAADFNGDGKPDIAGSIGATNVGQTGQVSIFLNTTPSPTSGKPTFASAYGVGSSVLSYGQLVVGDMNLDGKLEIVAADSSPSTTVYYVLTNDGTGQFPDTRIFNAFNKLQSHPGGLGIADWNNDGQPDVSIGTAWRGNTVPVSNTAVAGGIGLSFNATFQPLGLKTSTIPVASPGVPYSYQLPFTGGDSSLPYSVSLDSKGSKLPAGLTLSPTGLISGTPTQSGSFQPLFNITQPDGQRGSALAYLSVAGQVQATISPGALANAVAGIPYSQPFTTNIGPAIWGISQGALPTGMTLSQNGVLSGTPTVLGQYNFQVTATGAAYQTSVSYALNVQSVAAPIVTKLVRYGYHAQPTTLVASFSQALNVSAAANVGNYLLTSAGADGRFGTRDDKNIPLASATYNAGANTVTLGLVQKNIPLRQLYRLAITGTPTAGLQNTGGVFLGGQGIGAPGTNYVQIFNGKILAGPNLLLKSSKVKSAK